MHHSIDDTILAQGRPCYPQFHIIPFFQMKKKIKPEVQT